MDASLEFTSESAGMNSNKSEQEHRDHPRYYIDLGSFAVFRRDQSILPALITDISRGGLAFFYHQDEEWPDDDSERFYLFGEKCNVEDVPLLTTNDMQVTDTEHPVYQILAAQKSGPINIRRRGVKYGSLTRQQKDDIELLVAEYLSVLKRTA
jgi:hypothetical protein